MTTLEKSEAATELFDAAASRMKDLVARKREKQADKYYGLTVRRAIAPSSWSERKREYVAESVAYGWACGALIELLVVVAALFVSRVDGSLIFWAGTVTAALLGFVVAGPGVHMADRRLVVVRCPTAVVVWDVLAEAIAFAKGRDGELSAAMHAQLTKVREVARGHAEQIALSDGERRRESEGLLAEPQSIINARFAAATTASDKLTTELHRFGMLALASVWALKSAEHKPVTIPAAAAGSSAGDDLRELINAAVR